MRVPCALLSTRDTRANEQEALALELLDAADGIRVVGVAAVDDDITLLEMGFELSDKVVDGITSLDEHDDLARSLEFGHELLNRVSADNIAA
jgi:hypothetical protein